MSGVAAGAAATAAMYSAMINGIKASGAIVQVTPDDFLDILNRSEEPLVVHSPATLFTKNQYLTSYKGLFFYTKSPSELPLPAHIELMQAKKIWIPA
jgi:hypothetical protein